MQKSLEDGGGLGLTREVSVGSERYLCYSKYSEAKEKWVFGVSDGVDVWSIGLSQDDVKEYSHDVGESSYISDISQTLRNGDVQLLKSHNCLKLCLKCSSQQTEFDLYEAPAAERRQEMKSLLFSVWDNLQTANSRIQSCEKDLAEAQQKTSSSSTGGFGEITVSSGTTSKTAAANRPKRAKGASLVNPSNKRRKAATGVVFGDDS